MSYVAFEPRARLEATWNTGRPYTVNGQRVAVWTVELEDSRFLLMRDYDRDITYCFKHEDFELEPDLRRYVMCSYDYSENRISNLPGMWRAVQDVLAKHPLATMRFKPVSL
jgi:hypothetical protein